MSRQLLPEDDRAEVTLTYRSRKGALTVRELRAFLAETLDLDEDAIIRAALTWRAGILEIRASGQEPAPATPGDGSHADMEPSMSPDADIANLRRTVELINAQPDPTERAKMLTDLLSTIAEVQPLARAAREQAAKEMHASGASLSAIGAQLGMSRQRAHQIIAGESAPHWQRQRRAATSKSAAPTEL